MGNEFNSFDDFLLSFNANPIETIHIMNKNRTFSNREWNEGSYKVLQKKLNEGNTLAEFYELASIKPEENIWKLLNTWLTLRDEIDEAKGIYPITDGLWRVIHPIQTYISLKDKLLNDIKVSPLVLEKFFKIYRPLDIGEHKKIFIEYDDMEYVATITREDKEKILLHWDEGFVSLLKNFYPKPYTETHEIGIDYELECRLFWHSGYKGIYACFDVQDLYIVLNKYLSNEIEVPSILIEKFFRLGGIENEESFRLTLKKEVDTYKRGKEFHGYIKKDGEKFFLKWDEKFIQLLKEQLPKDFFTKEQSNFPWQLHLKWTTTGARYTWWFDFTKKSLTNKTEHNAMLLDLRNEANTEQLVSTSSNGVSTLDEDIWKGEKSVVNSETEKFEITETEKEQVVKSRIGQSAFKKALLDIEKKCKLCDVSDERFLVASHIKPWSQSSNQERLDVNNGLLLCPNHDALFDKGYISFDDDGTILISDSLDEVTKVFLNINETMNISISGNQQQYMEWHQVNIFKSK